MTSDRQSKVLWDWPHREDIDGDCFDDLLSRRAMLRLCARLWPLRAIVLAYYAREYRVLVIGLAGSTPRGLFLIERVLKTRRKYLVILHFIPETFLPESTCDLSHVIRVTKLCLLRAVVRPVVQRCALACQQLTDWEVEKNAQWFDMPLARMRVIPYPLRTAGDQLRVTPGNGSVMASGRAACDWPTVFEAARGEGWPLTVVCGKRDLRRVNRLNADDRATVLSDISLEHHFRLVQEASVYLLALRSFEVSSGQIRLSDAIRAGTPAVVSVAPGIASYVEDESTVLSYPSGESVAARHQIRRLLADSSLAARLSEQAFETAQAWTRERYRSALQSMIAEAFAEAQEASLVPE